MKGLGVQLKAVSAAAPLLAAAMEFAAICGVYKLTDAFKDLADGTTAVEKYRKAFEQSEKTVEDNKSLLSEYQSELNSNKDKLKELQRLYDNKTITDAQKAELENLKYQNALLDEKLEKIQKISDEESKNQAKTAVNQFNAEFGGNADTQYTEFKKSNRNDSGTNETLMLDAMDNNTATNQLLTLKYFTDAYNRSVEDLKNGVENVTQEDVDNYSEALHLASEQFSSVSDALWNDLQTQKRKLDDVRGTEDFDENTYNNIISWEELFKNYVEEYRKAAEKLKQEADSNSLSQMVEFSATFKELNDIYSRLTDNSSLLSSVNEEIALSGRISADSLSRINDAFPENKYPEMTKALYEYQTGLIHTGALFGTLEECYNKDKDSYLSSLADRNSGVESFYNSVLRAESSRVKLLGEAYSTDFGNWKTIEEAKKKSELELISTLSGFWADYYKLVFNDKGQAQLEETGTGIYQDEQTAAYYENERLIIIDKINAFNRLHDELERQTEITAESLAQVSWEKLSKGRYSDKSSYSNELSGSASDAWKEEFDRQLKELDLFHEAGCIRDEQYYRELNSLNEKYFAGQKKYLDDYRSYAVKVYSGLKQTYKDMLDSQLGMMDMAASAVMGFLDEDIEGLGEQADKTEEEYDLRISALEDEKFTLEGQKYCIEDQIDLISEQISAIEKSNEARQQSVDLQKKQYELTRSLSQRTQRILKNGEIVYTADDSAVDSARNALDDADAKMQIRSLNDQTDALNRSMDSINDTISGIDTQISALEEEKNRITEGLREHVRQLQEYRDRWAEIPEQFSEAQNRMAARMILGQEWQYKALRLDEEMINSFGNSYTAVQEQMQLVTDASLSQIAGMAGLSSDALCLMSSSSSENSALTCEALDILMESGTASMQALSDNVELSAASTAGSLSDITQAANDARDALSSLSAEQDSMSFLGIQGIGTYPLPLMKNGGVAGVETASRGTVTGTHKHPLARRLGEDYLVAVREGEGFVPPEQVKQTQDSVIIVNRLADMVSSGETLPLLIRNAIGSSSDRKIDFNIPKIQFPELAPAAQPATSIKFGDINLYDVQEVNTLGEAIARRLPLVLTQKMHER
ncbi:MAG: hypothetical protein ACI4EJ_07915 [Bacteroides sp.]